MARQKGPFTLDQRPPSSRSGQKEMERYQQRRYEILTGNPGISWDVIDKSGSRLDDIETRDHDLLQNVEQVDVESTSSDLEKHITDLLGYEWERNRVRARSVTASTTALIGEHLSCNCTSGDITVTLPDPTTNTGYPIWIHKSDSSANKIITTVKNILFQNSTMLIISNGTDWVIS